MKRPFGKPATTYAEQVALLQQRGMVIDDPGEAEFYLQHLNYYRLGAYWLPFEADHATHRFRTGTRIADVLNLYIFDRELRLLVLDAIERVEVSVRSQWAYQLAHRHGPHAHLDPALAYRRRLWEQNLTRLADEVNRSDEAFIRHLVETYTEALPPVWAVCEVMSLGQLSRWYNSLKPMATRRAIANVYALDEKVLQSWLHHRCAPWRAKRRRVVPGRRGRERVAAVAKGRESRSRGGNMQSASHTPSSHLRALSCPADQRGVGHGCDRRANPGTKGRRQGPSPRGSRMPPRGITRDTRLSG